MMSLPVGVSSFNLLYGKTYDFEGNSLRTDVTVFPSHEIVWAATGERLTTFRVSSAAEAGEFGSVELPHTDQDGFVDTKGNAITNWWYKVQSTDFDGQHPSPVSKVRKLQVVTGIDEVDLDLVPADATVGPVGSVPIPPVLSVNGQVGAITVAPTDLTGLVPLTQKAAASGVASLDSATKVPVAQIPVQTIVSSVFPGVRALFIGDSVTNGSNAENASFAFPAMSVVIAGTAYLKVTVSGNSGLRSDQILTVLQGLDVSAIDHIHVQVGTNDASQLRTLAQFQAGVTGFLALAREKGKSISFGLVIPTAASRTAEDGRIRLYNAWLAQWARKNGVLVADTFTPLADLATGFLAAAYDSDTVHPNRAGHLRMAEVVAPVVIARGTPYVGREFMPSARGLLSNPTFAGTTGWTDQGGTGAATVSAVDAEPGDGLEVGDWLEMTIDATASGSNLFRQRAATLDPTKYSAGDVLMVTGRVGHNGNCSAKLQITNNATAFAVSADISPTVQTPGPVLATFTVPASPGTLRCGFVVTALAGQVGTAWLGECQITNLTTGGLVNDF